MYSKVQVAGFTFNALPLKALHSIISSPPGRTCSPAGAAACPCHAAPPSAWPSQEAALGLLISLRKYYQTEWVCFCILRLGAWSHDAAGLLS